MIFNFAILSSSFFLFFCSAVVIAEDKSPKRAFAGIVQHIKGAATVDEAQLEFKSIIHEGDTIDVKKNSRLKIIAVSRCTAVIYGPGQIKAPNPSSNPKDTAWKLKAKSLRWICDEAKRDHIQYHGVELQIIEGEVLIHDQKLLVLGTQVFFNRSELVDEAMYIIKNKNLNALRPLPDQRAKWEFDNSIAKPQGSREIDKGELQVTSRWILSAMLGGGGVDHENETFSQDNLSLGGARAQFQYLIGADLSLLGSFGFYMLEEDGEDDFKDCFINCNYPLQTRLENVFFMDMGLRLWHSRSYGWYFRLGVGTSEMSIMGNSDGHHFNDNVDHLVTMLTVGFDKFFVLSDPLGIDLNIELQYLRSISTEKFESGPNPPASHPGASSRDGNYSAFMLILSAGPMLMF